MNTLPIVHSPVITTFIQSLGLTAGKFSFVKAAEMLSAGHGHLWPQFDENGQGRLSKAMQLHAANHHPVQAAGLMQQTIREWVADPSGIDHPSITTNAAGTHLTIKHETGGRRANWQIELSVTPGNDCESAIIAISRPQGVVLRATIYKAGSRIKVRLSVDPAIELRPDHVDYLVDCLDGFFGFKQEKREFDLAFLEAHGNWDGYEFIARSWADTIYQALWDADVLISKDPAPVGMLQWLQDTKPEPTVAELTKNLKYFVDNWFADKAQLRAEAEATGDFTAYDEEVVVAAKFLAIVAENSMGLPPYNKEIQARFATGVLPFGVVSHEDFRSAVESYHRGFTAYRAYLRRLYGIFR